MIFESGYWKDEIQKIAERMKTRSHQKRWSERSYAKVEKDVFIAFYAIRKLLEAHKLSQSIIDGLVPAYAYPSTGKGVTRINSHRLDEHFDFSHGKIENLKLGFICNQVIHSYIFAPFLLDDKTLGGIFFSSDFERNKALFRLNIKDMVACLERIASDDPVALVAKFDPQQSEYIITQFASLEEYKKFVKSGADVPDLIET